MQPKKSKGGLVKSDMTFTESKSAKVPSKRAADFYDNYEEEDVALKKPKRNSKAKSIQTIKSEVTVKARLKSKSQSSNASVPKNAEKTKPQFPLLKSKTVNSVALELNSEPESASKDSDVGVDAILGAAFDDTESESESENENENGIDPDESDAIPEATLPIIPASISKQIANVKTTSSKSTGPNVVYIGRIPHGFYEQQMRTYFSQFGKITRLRLSRNKRSGKSKHYGFIEFESSDVAEIVQKAMNNYLMFGHILKVQLVPAEKIHEGLWVGANQRFKAVPWGDIDARKLKAPATREKWDARVKREEDKRKAKEIILKEYDYDFNIPKVKHINDLPSKVDVLKLDSDDTPKAIEVSQNEDTIDKEKEATISKGRKGRNGRNGRHGLKA